MKTNAAALLVILGMCVGLDAGAQTCFSTIQGPPGFEYPILDWRRIKGGALPQRYGYELIEDGIRIDVADGTSLGLAPNQMDIKLVTSLGSQKEIVAWNAVSGPIKNIATPGPFEGKIIPPDGFFRLSMRIEKTTCAASTQTIVLRKAKAFGILTNMYFFDTANFWHLWGGKIVTFTWIGDNRGSGQYLPCTTSSGCSLGTLVPRPVADRTVFRAGNWLFDANGGFQQRQWGQAGDLPVRGDYDSDGIIDTAVWRPASGDWHVIESSSGLTQQRQWGQPSDIPVPADYDGDGQTDFAVWRFSDGVWYVIESTGDNVRLVQWGLPRDIPVPADYDGDGRADFGVWRPLSGVWHVLDSSGYMSMRQWGQLGDVPLPADYDGDGLSDMAVWRRSGGNWYVIESSTGNVRVQQLGQVGDIPVPGDYDHDLRADLAVWRPSSGEWLVILSSTGQARTFQWGLSSDVPVPPGK